MSKLDEQKFAAEIESELNNLIVATFRAADALEGARRRGMPKVSVGCVRNFNMANLTATITATARVTMWPMSSAAYCISHVVDDHALQNVDPAFWNHLKGITTAALTERLPDQLLEVLHKRNHVEEQPWQTPIYLQRRRRP